MKCRGRRAMVFIQNSIISCHAGLESHLWEILLIDVVLCSCSTGSLCVFVVACVNDVSHWRTRRVTGMTVTRQWTRARRPDQTLTTFSTCPCGVWPKRRWKISSNRETWRYITKSMTLASEVFTHHLSGDLWSGSHKTGCSVPIYSWSNSTENSTLEWICDFWSCEWGPCVCVWYRD